MSDEQVPVNDTAPESGATTAPTGEGDMNVVSAFLRATSPFEAGEPTSENTPEPNPAGEPGNATAQDGSGEAAEPEADATEQVPAQEAQGDVLNEIAKLTPEDRELLMEQFKTFLDAQGKATTAPVQAPEQPPAQEQAQAQPEQPQFPSPAYEPITDDDLLDANVVNSKLAARDAYVMRQTQMSMIPFVGMLIDAAVTTREVAREYPTLRGRDTEVADLVVRLRNQNPEMTTDELVEKAATQLMRSTKTVDLVKRLQAAGRPIDARPGKPPVAAPAGNSPRQANGQFASKKQDIDPLASLIERMQAINR